MFERVITWTVFAMLFGILGYLIYLMFSYPEFENYFDNPNTQLETERLA